jgi:hypothetical protein
MQIVPTESVQIPLGGIATELEIRVESFPLFPSEINVFWKVSGTDVSKEGIIKLPQYIVDAWGTDDTVVKDYILFQLGLVAATTTTSTTILEETTTTTTTEAPIV